MQNDHKATTKQQQTDKVTIKITTSRTNQVTDKITKTVTTKKTNKLQKVGNQFLNKHNDQKN